MFVHVRDGACTVVTSYSVTADPFSSAAFHVTIARESPPRLVTPVGALGTVAGIAELLSSEAVDEP